MIKLIGKKIFTILRWKFLPIRTSVISYVNRKNLQDLYMKRCRSRSACGKSQADQPIFCSLPIAYNSYMAKILGFYLYYLKPFLSLAKLSETDFLERRPLSHQLCKRAPIAFRKHPKPRSVCSQDAVLTIVECYDPIFLDIHSHSQFGPNSTPGLDTICIMGTFFHLNLIIIIWLNIDSTVYQSRWHVLEGYDKPTLWSLQINLLIHAIWLGKVCGISWRKTRLKKILTAINMIKKFLYMLAHNNDILVWQYWRDVFAWWDCMTLSFNGLCG